MRHSGGVSEQTRVAVLCGGWSQEAAVSKTSGEAIIKALRKAGYEVLAVDPAKDLARFAAQLVSARPDVVFNALHGTGGEDGVIQGALEISGIPYTHSGVAASAMGLDKKITKLIAQLHNVAIAEDKIIKRGDLKNGHPMPTPYVVKPISEGSSVGVVIVHDDLPANVTENADQDIMVERFIDGQELTVAVLDTTDGPRALGVTRLVPSTEFYDYKAKYTNGITRHDVNPTDLPDAVIAQMKEWSVTMHRALGCRDMSRSDFRYNEKGGAVFLELNTHPGMTDLSLFPEQAAAAGIDFVQLVTQLVETALARGKSSAGQEIAA